MENNFLHYRHRLQMNISEFSYFLGLNLSQYSRYENQRTQPSLETLVAIRDRLRAHFPHITLDDLIK